MKEEGDKSEGLTIERLRQLKNYESLTDEQAKEIIDSIRKFVTLCHEHINLNKNNLHESKKEKQPTVKQKTKPNIKDKRKIKTNEHNRKSNRITLRKV
jgi:hypothetical protein